MADKANAFQRTANATFLLSDVIASKQTMLALNNLALQVPPSRALFDVTCLGSILGSYRMSFLLSILLFIYFPL